MRPLLPWTSQDTSLHECTVLSIVEVHDSTEQGDIWQVDVEFREAKTDQRWKFTLEQADYLMLTLSKGSACTILIQQAEGVGVRLLAVFPGRLQMNQADGLDEGK
jgi:hypothetical protein